MNPNKLQTKPNTALRRKAAGILVGALLVGGGYIADRVEDGLQNIKHYNTESNDFSLYNLAKKPIELNKIYKKEGINPLNLTFRTIVAGEPNPTFVAEQMGAKDFRQVRDEIDAQTSEIINKIPVNSMHPGQVIVIPNDQLKPIYK